MKWLLNLFSRPKLQAPHAEPQQNLDQANVPAAPPPIRLPPSDDFDQEVVGESHYQAALSAICGGKTASGHELECIAQLRLQPTNPHDRNAVQVLIHGRVVGYLPRRDAASFSRWAARRGFEYRTFEAPAVIVGGFERKGRQDASGHFGVRLRMIVPEN